MWVRIALETYIFILNFSLPPRSEQVNGAVANEIKHVHSPEVIVVLDPRYDLSYKVLYISACSIALRKTKKKKSTTSVYRTRRHNKNSVCMERNGSLPKPLGHRAIDIIECYNLYSTSEPEKLVASKQQREFLYNYKICLLETK